MFLKVKISYQTVGGYRLPSVVNAAVDLPGGQQLPLPLTFANCQVKCGKPKFWRPHASRCGRVPAPPC